ncbi:translocon-associated protein subunit alpha [Neltuma alba]|uniref:translocon-associated protein subunit alpha n=1 Tax=Neltuma alba TaxID=207710 RepID=UPI0010A555A8|nr:translocon-associated protein subunit alpha-like [Prosopis alba]XP_028776783.1 translocon-associated protein subunit alpha-like [Prosopis alba]
MAPINKFWIFCLALFCLASPLIQVARCQSDSDEAAETTEASDVGIVGQNTEDLGGESYSSAPGIDTLCVFPKNGAKLVPAGEETDLIVGVKNDGEASLKVIAIKASVHFPYNHHYVVQNLTAQLFNYASVPASAQGTFPYTFAVSQYLQPGAFDLVGTIVYEIDQHPYQSTFYNGTIEVVDAGSFLSVESVFLVTLGTALLVLFVLWIYGQVQNASKKTKKGAKVEVGTRTTSMDEWLEGTAYAMSNNKSKKKDK